MGAEGLCEWLGHSLKGSRQTLLCCCCWPFIPWASSHLCPNNKFEPNPSLSPPPLFVHARPLKQAQQQQWAKAEAIKPSIPLQLIQSAPSNSPLYGRPNASNHSVPGAPVDLRPPFRWPTATNKALTTRGAWRASANDRRQNRNLYGFRS